ncbi:ABC transporter ATP-binding protein [Anaeromicropila populeti]|uniref:Energy-coupling factor transport system ATP-binding protein n=1 Tax=Anaeromicropila populeti TaxID=37658 RepID=A0A1I6JX77_9FIRM|nr:energy-coupling factor ABC transporter ATP-binding protein [Anaeromicropila populeti]SFR83572.1 energy-coupling factor transport system ATP-binding protein [Anaeromicropila populeti]
MISIKNVTFQYAGKQTGGVYNINIEIARGECVLFCGRSGCGKTTITRLVNGLIPYFYEGELTGEVHVDGMNISETPMHLIAEKVGSVFQNPRSQFFNTDTESEIAFGIENMSWSKSKMKRRIEETTKELRMEKLRKRGIMELSGGEKQKVAFASIYAMSPEVFVLDEPSSNLDVDAIGDLKNTLSFLKNENKTILISEHRLYYLKDIVDRIVYVEDGEVKNIYQKKDFLDIPVWQCAGMGLRAFDLNQVQPDGITPKKNLPLLEMKNFSVSYKKKRILEQVSLSAEYGEIIGIVGQNGAGKSTFSRALCGLHKNHDGECFWNGKRMNDRQRLKLCYMVMQNVSYQLFAESVDKECSFGIKEPDTYLVSKTLTELGLYEYKDKHPNTLSGGQKQRLAVAVSMICKKEILIFDEPTSGLDYDSMIQVSHLLKKLAQMNKIIYVVTHDYEFLASACNRVLHFKDGRLADDYSVDSEHFQKLQKMFIKE